MSIVVRRTEPHEYRLAANAFMVALMEAPATDEQWERSLPSWQDAPSFSAWDGDTCVGHGSHDLVDTTVPGGSRLSTSAVTRVGVLPTHRRRGIGTGLMQALIDDARQRDLVLMSLRASEATIYGRYGFGVAGEFCSATIDPARLGPLTGATTGGSFRILEPATVAPSAAPRRAGSMVAKAGLRRRHQSRGGRRSWPRWRAAAGHQAPGLHEAADGHLHPVRAQGGGQQGRPPLARRPRVGGFPKPLDAARCVGYLARMVRLLALLVLIATPAFAASKGDWFASLYTGDGVELRNDERIFTLFAIFNAMGFDEGPVTRKRGDRTGGAPLPSTVIRHDRLPSDMRGTCGDLAGRRHLRSGLDRKNVAGRV